MKKGSFFTFTFYFLQLYSAIQNITNYILCENPKEKQDSGVLLPWVPHYHIEDQEKVCIKTSYGKNRSLNFSTDKGKNWILEICKDPELTSVVFTDIGFC